MAGNHNAIACLIIAAGLMASASFVSAQEDQSRPASTSMGVICWAAIVEAGYQVASRCDLGERSASEETLAAYSNARDALAGRLLAQGWNKETLSRFRAQQGSADAPTQELCAFDRENDTGRMFLAMAQEKPQNIKMLTDAVLEKPGPPRWGTCL